MSAPTITEDQLHSSHSGVCQFTIMVFCKSENTGVNILNTGIYNTLYTYITSSLLQNNTKQNVQSHYTPTYKMHYMFMKHETRGSFIQVRYSPFPDWILH
jgi:hypothetical protein